MSSHSSSYQQSMDSQFKKYRTALTRFRVSKSYWKGRIQAFQSYSMLQQHTEIRPYEEILFGLHARPKMPFDFAEDPDELHDFCEAFVIAWRLLPDAWVGLQMMLDCLAENFCKSDVQKINDETLIVVKEIARNRHWPNNQLCGPMFFSGQAKTILARVTRNTSFAEATTVDVVRTFISEPSQPIHRKPKGFNSDRRRTCSNPTCFQVETVEPFKKCSRCEKKSYCTKECQHAHWKEHKKICTKRNRK